MRWCVLLVLWAGVASADGDAEAARRGRALLASFTKVEADLCKTTRLGLFVDEKLVGYLAFQVVGLTGKDEGPQGYNLHMAAEMRLGSATLVRAFDGRCDVHFRPIEGKGSERRTEGGRTVVRKGRYTRAGAGYSWTGEAADGTETTRVIAGVDGFDGLHLVLASRWPALAVGQAHALRLLSEDDGVVTPVRITRKANAGAHVVVEAVEGKGKAKTLTLTVDGALVSITQQGAPFVMKPISEARLARFRESTPPSVSASRPSGAVALFFAAVAKGDLERLTRLSHPRALIYSTTIDALAGSDEAKRAEVRKQLDARWKEDGGAGLTRAFFANMVARAKKSSGGKMPTDPAQYLPFLREVSRDAARSVVHFRQGERVALIFEMAKRGGTWVVTGQRRPK